MSERVLIDTNLVVRHLVRDNEQHAKAATALFEACDDGEVVLVLLQSVLSECVFVLESFYKHSRGDIAAALKSLVASPGVEIADGNVLVDALTRYAESKMHFVDCTLAAYATTQELAVASFDQDFKKVGDVKIYRLKQS